MGKPLIGVAGAGLAGGIAFRGADAAVKGRTGFGDGSGAGGVAFLVQLWIPLRNRNWSASGQWVRLARIGSGKYFPRKVRHGKSEPVCETLALHVRAIRQLRFGLPFSEGVQR